MHTENPEKWTHHHVFDNGNQQAERGTWIVMWITAATMLLEISAGWWYNSMALLADGWHMSSHAVAIGLTAAAYAAARKYANDARFAFGTWKIEVLSGFASAIFLMGVAAMMVFGSVERLLSPQPIHYREAIVVSVFGLLVNVVCAVILGKAHHHDHHGHDHAGHSDHGHYDHGHHNHGHQEEHKNHGDLNLKSAYLHVIADAATSLLAIVALLGGWIYGWSWLDPVMGIVGAILIVVWAKGLIVETGKVLLDREMDHPVVAEIREVVEVGETQITDLHVWRVGKRAYSCAMTILTHEPGLNAAVVREALAIHEEIVHSTIEIHLCPDCPVDVDS